MERGVANEPVVQMTEPYGIKSPISQSPT